MAAPCSLFLSFSVSSTVRARADAICGRAWTVGTPGQTRGLVLKTSAAQASKFGGRVLVSCARKSPDDFPQKRNEDEAEESEFVAPRVTPDYVGKDSIKPPSRVVKDVEGPWITRWGGNVRAGKYNMGQGTDRIIDIFANGNAMLVAAGGLVVLFFVLLQFRPDAPSPPGS